MSSKYVVLLFLGLVLLTCATTSLARTRLEEEEVARAQPFGGKPPKPKPPPKHKPPTVPHDHDDERKLTTVFSEESVEDQRPLGKPPKGKGGNPPHGKYPKHPPVVEENDDVNKDAYKPTYKSPYKPPQPPRKPPHKPPSTN